MDKPYRERKLLRKGSDLTWNNYHYLITMITKDRRPIFGNILNGKMNLSRFGEIAQYYWERTEEVYSYTKLFEFVIMPDHIHAIVKILPTQLEVKSISTMIKSFKREVTKEIHLIDPTTPKLIWQQSFWVKGFTDLNKLKAYEKYIRNNPQKAWEKEFSEK